MKRRLAVVKRHYAFSDAEKAAFSLYYRTVYPLECDLCQRFESAIDQKDEGKVSLILDWVDYQQTRGDLSL
mgnify:CR=1 FL=1